MIYIRTRPLYCAVRGFFTFIRSKWDKLHRGALLPQQLNQGIRREPNGSGIIIGMDPDELAAVVLIQQEGDPVLLVIQCAKGSDRAGRQAQQLGQLLRPGKGKRPMPQPGFQRFQVGTLFSVQYQQQ